MREELGRESEVRECGKLERSRFSTPDPVGPVSLSHMLNDFSDRGMVRTVSPRPSGGLVLMFKTKVFNLGVLRWRSASCCIVTRCNLRIVIIVGSPENQEASLTSSGPMVRVRRLRGSQDEESGDDIGMASTSLLTGSTSKL